MTTGGLLSLGTIKKVVGGECALSGFGTAEDGGSAAKTLADGVWSADLICLCR
jgi:hypothetical protein